MDGTRAQKMAPKSGPLMAIMALLLPGGTDCSGARGGIAMGSTAPMSLAVHAQLPGAAWGWLWRPVSLLTISLDDFAPLGGLGRPCARSGATSAAHLSRRSLSRGRGLIPYQCWWLEVVPRLASTQLRRIGRSAFGTCSILTMSDRSRLPIIVLTTFADFNSLSCVCRN